MGGGGGVSFSLCVDFHCTKKSAPRRLKETVSRVIFPLICLNLGKPLVNFFFQKKGKKLCVQRSPQCDAVCGFTEFTKQDSPKKRI